MTAIKINQENSAPTPFEEALDKTGNGLYNILLVITSSIILLAIGVDLFGFSLVVAAACDLELSVTEKGILTSLPFVGILLVSYFWGYIADTRGRRFALVIPLQIAFILSCISSLSTHWLFLGLMKFFSVCFSCAANSVTYTLVGESCVQRMRSKYMLLMTCLIILSPAVAGILTYPILKLDFAAVIPGLGITFKPWRLLIIVLALPTGIGATAMYFFHESPKFLFSVDRKEDALKVLKRIYAINHRNSKNNFKVTGLTFDEVIAKRPQSMFKAMFEQSAPLFRPPYLLRTIQLFYIVGVVYITNNSFLIWLPHILNLLRLSLESNTTDTRNICSLISIREQLNGNSTVVSADICLGTVEDNVIMTLIASQSIFAFLNFLLSYLPNHRRTTLLSILIISSLSGICLNLVPDSISSIIFFVAFTCTNLGMGIMASYFVELYPTNYRGMVQCLSIMVGRSFTFIGINAVGNLVFNHCQLTFYFWSLLVFTSVLAAWFLPPDKLLTTKGNVV